MAKGGADARGTSGAQKKPDTIASYLSVQFKFDPGTRDRLLTICQPSEAWIEQYRNVLAPLVDSERALAISVIEACGRRFLQGKVRALSKVDERKYLQALELHSGALVQLLTEFPEMENTVADPFYLMERVSRDRGQQGCRHDHWAETMRILVTLRTFAQIRISRGLDKDGEGLEEETRRRTTYPRFVLIADLLAVYVRITGKEATAYATKSKSGARQVSDAVDFISVALPPILKAARVKGSHVLGDELIRTEIANVKQYWEKGIRPELEYIGQGLGRAV
jgi:hypothetical protein